MWCGVKRVGRVQLPSMIGGRLIEALSPRVEKVFSECHVCSRPASSPCKNELQYGHQSFSTLGLNVTNFVNIR